MSPKIKDKMNFMNMSSKHLIENRKFAAVY